jgi:nitrate reductase alpha subunit
MFCGCVGKNGGGLNHYVGQEKLAPVESWSRSPSPRTGVAASRLQNAPSWHYVHSDQWRYEKALYRLPHRPEERPAAPAHWPRATRSIRCAPCAWAGCRSIRSSPEPARAVQRGREPPAPRPTRRSSPARGREAEVARSEVLGRRSRRAGELAARLVHLARQRDHGQRQGPRVLPQALPRHAPQRDRRRISPRDPSRRSSGTRRRPPGKMDLVVDLNFRMDTSALYSDIVLPAATWYEKTTSTRPTCTASSTRCRRRCRRAGSRRATGRSSRRSPKASRAGREALPRAGEGHRRVAAGARHAAEIAQPTIKDWIKGECEAIPGKTMPAQGRRARLREPLQPVHLLGPLVRRRTASAPRHHYQVKDLYDEIS